MVIAFHDIQNIAHALEVMAEREKTYFFASEHSILGKSQLYETLNMEDAVPTQKGNRVQIKSLSFHLCNRTVLLLFDISSLFLIITGWGLQPNSEYRELFNYWIHKLDESGLKDRIWHEWTYEVHDSFIWICRTAN